MNKRVEEIFSRALELEPSEREALLREECGEDDDLRMEVEAMLRDAVLADEYLFEAPPSPGLRPHTAKPGDIIGAYTLLEKLGEGGFGDVWMAVQERPIKRTVALKVIKAGLDTDEFLARFDSERQALAMMEHSNIARVLDAGATSAGRPYFVMELVRGVAITKYCDEKALGISQRLSLFLDVCAAIGHAHQKGVIHRDLKPSNILVAQAGGQPVVKVIDFGIAKAMEGKLTDHTVFTAAERFLGTPAYMSPEQAGLGDGDLDTRVDVYGLGVLLYELLAGKPPFDSKSLIAAGYEEMRRIIREEEPPTPTQSLKAAADTDEGVRLARSRQTTPDRIRKLIDQDLDSVVRKAIEKDRRRRYATTDALASDITRFLSGLPVEASPPSALYTFQKFAMRHRGAMAATAAIVLLLVAATVISIWLAARATKAEKLATKSERLASEQLAQATAARNSEKQALDDANSISGFLGDMFRSPDPGRDGRTVTVAEVLDAAIPKLEKDLAGQPERQVRLLTVLADTYDNLGLYRNALDLREQAVKVCREKLGTENVQTLTAIAKLQDTYLSLGFYERSTSLISDKKEQLQRFAALMGKKPSQDKESQAKDQERLEATYDLASAYASEERYQEAEELLNHILLLQQQAHSPDNATTVHALELLAQISSVGKQGREEGDRAAYYQEEALAASRKVFGPEGRETLDAMDKLAFIEWKIARRTKDALNLRRDLVNLRRKVFGPDYLPLLYESTDLALLLHQAHQTEEARVILEDTLPRIIKVAGRNARSTADTMGYLAYCYLPEGRAVEAYTLLKEAGPILRTSSGAVRDMQ